MMSLSLRRALGGFQVIAALVLLMVAAAGEEPAREFLRAAQEHGYGEVAVDYLQHLHDTKRLPRELAETYDLELSRSLRIAVGEAFNAAEADQRLAKAQSHLDKFLKEHPDHPEVARAIESWGRIALDRALQRMRLARSTRDKAQKEKHLAAARADLAEAKTRLSDATERYLATYTQLKSAVEEDGTKSRSSATQSRKRQAEQAVREAEFDWLDCRLNAAKVDFYLGQTWPDPKSPERKAALGAAASAFDAIFQSHRESLIGLHAHLWHGRAADELGDDRLALDIYDEVLAISPEGRDRETGLEPLFAQVQYYRLLAVARTKGDRALLAEAMPWMQLHRAWKRLDGYQGVALEVAKANWKLATDNGEKKAALAQSALVLLADIAKVPSEHQQEAILLRREYTRSGSQDRADAKTFDEALALGEETFENQEWTAAAAHFAKALQLKTSVTDAARVANAVLRLDQARYQVAAADYAAGKFDEALAAAEAMVAERPDGAMAATASSLAVAAALSSYARGGDKQAGLARLTKIANDMISRWPDKPEADDARIALGQAELVQGHLPAAVEAFEHVNPRSQRYGAAMFLAGQTNWRLYLAARSRAADSDKDGTIALRAKAEQQLRASLAAERKGAEPGNAAARQSPDTPLLLAELLLDVGQPKEAAELVEPLVQAIRAERPEPLGNAHLRVFLAAVHAHLALEQLDKAGADAALLAEVGADAAPVNGVLASILKMLADAWKQSTADEIEARTAGDPMRRAAAEAAAKSRKELLSQFVDRILARKNNTLAAMIFLGDTCAQLGKADPARDLYRSILQRADDDPAFKQANARALTRIQAQLVGLLRQKKQFPEGLAQVDRLIEQYPNALEPKMEKGRLLQDWADVDPERFDDAVAHWTALRMRLSKAARKPPEYYEVVYNAANCLFIESLKTQNDEKALQAEQLLNATLVLSPRLNGPEMVARYKELLHKVRQLRGRDANVSAKR